MPKKKMKKIFVLDTSVLLYDFEAAKNFEDNDVAIPITVLEELDTLKKVILSPIYMLMNLFGT